MARRHPQTFWCEFTKSWYVQIGKKQHPLGPDRDEAFRLYHEMMDRRWEAEGPATPAPSLAAVEVIDLFLEWAQNNRAPLTYEAYRQRLQALVDSIPPTLPAGNLKPFHLTRVMDAKGGWGPTGRTTSPPRSTGPTTGPSSRA